MAAPRKKPEATKQIARMFKKKRLKMGLSFTQLAKKTGMGRTSLSDIESHRKEIAIGEYLTICEALNIPPREAMPDTVEITHEQKLLIESMVKEGASKARATEFVRINCRSSVDYD